jgi:patatin-related protein
MKTSHTDQSASKKKPSSALSLDNVTEEIRFAVVMYGGLSLAIYMNGVAQELLHLVRSTARSVAGGSTAKEVGELTGTERVYRKLSQMLVGGAPKDEATAPIRTRFVVDILSGSSAGGINAVFLAKALANDESIDKLKELWRTQGDACKLLNDAGSLEGNNLKRQIPPKSLFNGQRMYWELLNALEDMDKNFGGALSPNVEELDLFVTATDVRGQVVNLQLADKPVEEFRHRNVFHFVYSNLNQNEERPERNDFERVNNPFLAFAARCTSAHPAVFETMSLKDIDETLAAHDNFKNGPLRADHDGWHLFYKQYLKASSAKSIKEQADDFARRHFNDGGVLDNQPFGPTLDALPLHHADVPVTRKLVYIEPAPDHPERRIQPGAPPDFIENAWLSLSTLPRYEPIREHLQRVLERNRLIERVEHITQGIEEDVRLRYFGQTRPLPMTAEQFGNADMGEMIREKGDAWGGYQRLRVAEVTDDLTRLISRMSGFDEDSDEFKAIRYIVRFWRIQHYFPHKTERKYDGQSIVEKSFVNHVDKFTQNMFLMRFDFLWRLRRLRFVMSKIDDVACFDARGMKIVKNAEDLNEDRYSQYPQIDDQTPEIKKDDLRDLQDEFREALVKIKKELNEVYRTLRIKRQQIWASYDPHPAVEPTPIDTESLAKALSKPGVKIEELSRLLIDKFPGKEPAVVSLRDRAVLKLLREQIANLRITRQDLLKLLERFSSGAERDAAIENLVDKVGLEKFQAFANAAALALDEVMSDASKRCDEILHIDSTTGETLDVEGNESATPAATVLKVVRHYYRYFDDYDVIAYPILYATDVGDEVDFVEVFRISPEDATSLINEKEEGILKLAGTKLSDFGAFFKEEFRTNDILWGRLDGAERLISALLPDNKDEEQRKALIKEAHRAIITEDLGVQNDSHLLDILERLEKDQKHRLAEDLDNPRVQFALGTYLEGLHPDEYFQKKFRDDYEKNFQFNSQDMVVDAARASKVFGGMLEGYATLHQISNKRIVWVTRLAQLFWGLVEVAIPGNVPHLVFHHWLKLLYLFEFLLILFSTLMLSKRIQEFSLLLFGITVAVHTAELIVRDALQSKRRWWNFILSIVVLLCLVFLVIGVFTAFAVGLGFDTFWRMLNDARNWFKAPGLTGGLIAVIVVGLFLLWSIRDDLRAQLTTRKRTTAQTPERK